MEPLLTLKGLRYAPPGGPEIISRADLSVAGGEMVWLSGPSGGGKSTLLRVLNRLAEPSAGVVRLRGRPLDQWEPTRLRRRVALLPQTPVMTPASLRENLLLPFGLRAARGAAPPEPAELERLLASLGLEEADPDTPAQELSVGQRQRVALGRLLLMEPEVLLLDEPVAALDPASRERVERLAGLYPREERRAVVMVSHLEPLPVSARVRRLRLEAGVLEEW
jgi:putative ABC transport system ATP-binding protein